MTNFNFADAVKEETKWKRTENDLPAMNTSSDALVDLFAEIGAMRNRTADEKCTLFEEAYKQDPLVATKILFYARDVRGGLGERQTFKDILNYLATYHHEAVVNNIKLIGEYGRWDDIYALVGTPVEDEMWTIVRSKLTDDLTYYFDGNFQKISLLAKWLKTADASSEKTRKLGIYTAKKLGWSVYDYKRRIRTLRKALKIVERDMSANRWSDINYSAVPSKAMNNYRNAFYRHDEDRFSEFTSKALTGEVKINSGTLFPYDIIEKYHVFYDYDWRTRTTTHTKITVDGDENTLEAQWRQLPNYVKPGTNAIVIADTSGSMEGRPLATALGLAIYFAQRNTGAYRGLWMNFSTTPHYQKIKGSTLRQILSNINYIDWEGSTDCEAAFSTILNTAIGNHVKPSEMPKALIIISDMEFNGSGGENWSFYDKMKARFARYGYEIPEVIFWNVDARHDTFHASADQKGVQLVSGQSASTFKNVVEGIGKTPYQLMMDVIGSPRYDPITIV